MKQYPPVSFAALAAIAIAVVALPSCADHSRHRIAFASTEPAEEAPLPVLPQLHIRPKGSGRVVLVTIDGVRANDVFEGADPSLRPGSKVDAFLTPEALMPRTHRLVATRGVALGMNRLGCATVRTASGANVSLPGYLEIFTGRKTRCRDNNCARTELPTVLDEASDAGLSPVASIGSWEMLSRATSKGSSPLLIAEGAVRWPGSRPLASDTLEQLVSAGERTEPYPGSGRYRPDASTIAIALEYMSAAAPPVLHVGLGDADEYGHRNDYPAYLDAIAKADTFIGQLADMLDGMGELGAHTTVMVTTDHGRNRDFQHHGSFSFTSAHTFVLAFGGGITPRGVVCPSRDITLTDIAPTMRQLLGLRPDTSPEAGRPIEEIVGTRAAEVARATPVLRPMPND